MKAARWAVTWQGRLVGWLENPKLDFPHDYGQWIPNGASGDEFIAALGQAVEEEAGLEVILQGTTRAVTYGLPDEHGELDFRMLSNQTQDNVRLMQKAIIYLWDRIEVIIAVIFIGLIATPWLLNMSHNFGPKVALPHWFWLIGAVAFVLAFLCLGASLEIGIPLAIGSFLVSLLTIILQWWMLLLFIPMLVFDGFALPLMLRALLDAINANKKGMN